MIIITIIIVPGGEFSLDGGHVGALLQTPKGYYYYY